MICDALRYSFWHRFFTVTFRYICCVTVPSLASQARI